MIGDNDPSHKIILNNHEITSSKKEKLLGILLDRKFNFDTHITSLCKKADYSCSCKNKLLPHPRSENLASPNSVIAN